MEVTLKFCDLSADQLRLIQNLAEIIGALKAKPESGTTGCSAGRMPELSTEDRPVQPAGNPAGGLVVVLIAQIEHRLKELRSAPPEAGSENWGRQKELERLEVLIKHYKRQGAA